MPAPVASPNPLAAFAARVHKHRGLIVPIGFILLLVVIVVPLPPAMMDVLIVFNLAISIMVLMTTIYMKEPLEFSVFPSLLLGLTLFRLVLNVASTRLILSAEAATPAEAEGVAGGVIQAFGTFVAGESLIVGCIIFLILVIVQFVVITKGATRISEVAARFTLDAMPGKQMAIDADLNAGAIDDKEARRRREKIGQEADFYGAMDGASKFVRGDAIAGLIITLINIVGGIAIGTLQRGWEFGQTAEVFTRLTIGDGLTSQLPAFVVSIAAALIVTRSGTKEELGKQMTAQMIAQPTGLAITAGFLVLLTLTPMPTLPLLFIAGGMLLIAFNIDRANKRAASGESAPGAAGGPGLIKPEPPSPESLLKLDTIELEVGYGLVALVDANQGGDLLERIAAVRRQLAVELGFILPPVRIRDNLQLPNNDYRFKIKGTVAARGVVMPSRLLAIDSGIASGPIEGEPGKEPAFGLDAWWIDPGLKNRAETMNYTVVDPTSVVATHLTELVRTSAADLLTRQEVSDLVAQLKTKSPKLVEEAIPGLVKVADLHRILQNLLRERVSIRDLETIVETLADWAPKTKDLDVLTEYVRNALRRLICQQHALPADAAGAKPRLICVTLDPQLEDLINSYVDRSAVGTSVTMPPAVAAQVSNLISGAVKQANASGHYPVVLTQPQVRAVVRQLIESTLPTTSVLGYNEVASGVDVESVAMVSPPGVEAARAGAAA